MWSTFYCRILVLIFFVLDRVSKSTSVKEILMFVRTRNLDGLQLDGTSCHSSSCNETPEVSWSK